MYKEHFNRLPDIYRQPNNEKIYEVLHECGFNARMAALDQIRESQDIDKATGHTLDLHGLNVDIKRPVGLTDEEHRKLIKVKIFANRSKGDIPSINKIMSFITDDYVAVSEGWWDYTKEPAAMIMYLNEQTKKIPFYIIDLIKAGGVKVYPSLISDPEVFNFILTNYEFPNELKVTDQFTTEDKVPGILFNEKGNFESKTYEFPVSLGITDIMRTETIVDTDTNIKLELENYNPHNKVEFIRPGTYQVGEGEI